MVFFTNRCKNKNCPLLKKTLQLSTVIIHWIACIGGRFFLFLFFFFPFDFSKWISIISSSSVALALLRSLWAQIIGGQIFFYLQLKPKPECSPVQLSRHCQTVSRTALRGAGPAPAPRCGSVDAELPGWWLTGHRRSELAGYCSASGWSEDCKGTEWSLLTKACPPKPILVSACGSHPLNVQRRQKEAFQFLSSSAQEWEI